MLKNWNRRTLRLVNLWFAHCWSAPAEIIKLYAVYATCSFSDGIVQSHISDWNTWIIVPSDAKVLVGLMDGTIISDILFLGLPDGSIASNASIRKRV